MPLEQTVEDYGNDRFQTRLVNLLEKYSNVITVYKIFLTFFNS